VNLSQERLRGLLPPNAVRARLFGFPLAIHPAPGFAPLLCAKLWNLQFFGSSRLPRTAKYVFPAVIVWLTDHCSSNFLSEITRAALLTVVLGVTAVLSTGCASTRNGFNARLISPVTNNQQAADPGENDMYQPAQSPAFNDFFGS
jgi:hypothetical protein